MVDFRKSLFAFAGLVTLISTASAQVVNSNPLTCTAFVANQPIMRQEGQTEPAGDIIIQCSGLLSGAQTGSQTLSLYVAGAAITSRTLSTSGTNGTPTEAALLVNDVTATAAQGVLQNGALVFSNFTLPNPGTGAQFQVRVTNVRVNANSLAAGSFVTGTVLATFPVQNQSGLVLGAVQQSLSVTVATPITSFAQCTSTTATLLTALKISELVNTAFKAPASCDGVTIATGCTPGVSNGTPGQWYQNGLNTESQTVLATGLPNWTNTGSATPGKADAATRFRVNFSNVPAGVTITVPTSIPSGTSLINATSSDIGAFSAVSGSTISLTGPGSVTYEVRAQSGSNIDSFTIPVTVAYAYAPPSTPNVGSVLVSATYAPTSAETTSAVPRFADTSVLTPLFSVAACQTDLLFTFLTNQAGFDTGLEIANTSADPFGTAAQSGTCTLNWYGTGPAAGTATTTPPVAAGSYYVNLVSTAAAGFQGYMIAVCNFQYGHGFAFISDGYGQPGKGLSQGYLASIIPTPGLQAGAVRNANDASKATINAGEALNQ